MDMKRFGRLIYENRKLKDMTQEALAQKAGCSKNYISMLERAAPHSQGGGAVQPSEELVDSLAITLGIPLDEARLLAGYAPLKALEVDAEFARLMDGLTPQQRRLVYNVAKAARETVLTAA